MTTVIRTVAELQACCEQWRLGGERVGLVPTMGALHDGHISLVHQVRDAGATRVVLTLFVNPTQFAAGEDLDRYPRTFDADLDRCTGADVDVLFFPEAAAMYPAGYQTYVSVDGMTQVLEGTFRPTHFRGVTTIVAKLFNATGGTCIAAFGRKDYQQWRVIETMARELNMPVTVLGCPIVRESDGLALSSRNRYLSETERKRALCLWRGLSAAREAFEGGERDAEILRARAEREVAADADRVDYVAIVDANDLTSLSGPVVRAATILIAAHIGTTRLIDNLTLDL